MSGVYKICEMDAQTEICRHCPLIDRHTEDCPLSFEIDMKVDGFEMSCRLRNKYDNKE